MRIGILGMGGRMGRQLVDEARSAGHEVVGGTLRPGSSRTPPDGVPAMPLMELAAAVDAVIDFTHPSTVDEHARVLAAVGTPWVLGTTGLAEAENAAMARATERTPVTYAANFGVGLNILVAFAERLRAVLPSDVYDAEIVEMHHRQKVDAPSGSAIILGEAVARGRGVALTAVMESGRDGHTGARKPGAIGFASMRGGQVVGEHTLLFASAGEHIALTHRAMDRGVFASGAVRAAAWTVGKAPGLYSIRDVLGI